MKYIYKILVITFLISSSCIGQKNESKNVSIKEVMELHDEIMPKMGDLFKLVEQLKSKPETPEKKNNVDLAKKELQTSNKAMMTWMNNFGKSFDKYEVSGKKALTKEKQQLLNEEEVKLKALNKIINTSMANVKKLLAKS